MRKGSRRGDGWGKPGKASREDRMLLPASLGSQDRSVDVDIEMGGIDVGEIGEQGTSSLPF